MTQWPAPGGQEAAHNVPPRLAAPTGPYWTPAPGWSPPPAKPPGPSPAKFFAVLLVVLTLIVAGLQLVPAPDVPPSGSNPRPSAGTPSEEPSDRSKPNSEHPKLTDNALYRQQVSGSCPEIRKAPSKDAYKNQVETLLTCLADIYEPLVTSADGQFAPVQHTFYGSRVDTPCGRQTDAYAFYCERDATIYLSEQVYTDAQYARLAVADTVIHEYGHHVQSMIGIFDAADALSESREVTVRREELQVYCWTYYVFASVPSFQLTDDDRSFFLDLWGHTNDPEGHGSVKAQQYWGPRGLEGRNLGACNTWSASKDRVH